jgi:predicted ATP-dependent protease
VSRSPQVLQWHDQYQRRRADLAQRLGEQREAQFAEVRALAAQLGFAVEFTPMGVATVPLLEPGKPLTPEAFELLPDPKKADIRARGQELARRTEEVLHVVRRLEREAHDQVHALDREVVSFAVGHLLDALRTKYAEFHAVSEHLDSVQADLVANLEEFRATEPESLPSSPMPAFAVERAYNRYGANVLVTSTPGAGAPVVLESNPTYYNLLGRVDYRATVGAMHTDFQLIRPGALHRANGGYLVLQARDVLLSPFAWHALKRALRDGELRIENLGEQFSAFPTATLKPEPIALNVKVVLIGDLQTYMLLYGLDPDFQRWTSGRHHSGYQREAPDAQTGGRRRGGGRGRSTSGPRAQLTKVSSC